MSPEPKRISYAPLWWVGGLLVAGALAVAGLASGHGWLTGLGVMLGVVGLWGAVGLGLSRFPKRRYSGYDYSLPGHWGRAVSRSAPPLPDEESEKDA